MFTEKLCPNCKTGQYTYQLDSSSPECPYLSCHNGKSCSMFERINEPENQEPFGHSSDKTADTPTEK